MPTTFFSRLEARARTIDSLLCIGLDPVSRPDRRSRWNAGAARRACLRLIDATSEVACAFKPNSAFFEACGPDGMQALRQVIAAVPADIPVILDAKRGDIPSTAQAYARAAFDVYGAGAVTVSPYLGGDALAPFLERPDRAAFVLCRTSNPGAGELQDLPIDAGSTLYERVAALARHWAPADRLGLVMGAGNPAAVARVRTIAPDVWLLVPGVGTQGGDLRAVLQAGLRADGLGVLINASGSIANAADPRAEARRLRDEINAVRADLVRSPRPAETEVDELAGTLVQAGCVGFGQFTLKSGGTSPIYLDLRRLASSPAALARVADAYARVLAGLRFDRLAGIPYAALPIATAIALRTGRPLIYPRREMKDYGTRAQVEGGFQPGETAVVIDDLATTGESKIETIRKLESAGLRVQDVVVLIDREQGAGESLQAAGYRLHAVATLRPLVAAWQRLGAASAEQASQVEAYLAQSQ